MKTIKLLPEGLVLVPIYFMYKYYFPNFDPLEPSVEGFQSLVLMLLTSIFCFAAKDIYKIFKNQ